MAAVVLLDGGMGQELIHRAGDRPMPLWSTSVMMAQPGLVRQVHADYFAAGATVATTNTYAVHRDRLAQVGLAGHLSDLIGIALAEAKAARDAHGSGRIAGSVGPLVESYRPDLHPPHAVAVPIYAEVAALLAPGVDLILGETIASLAHLRALGEGVARAGRPFWLSVTVEDRDGSVLRSGERVTEAARIAADLGAGAVLANCSAPEAMAAALGGLAAAGLPFGAYANGFQRMTSDFLKGDPACGDPAPRRDLSPPAYARYALDWVARGASIVGGCCETGPAHIAAVAEALRAAGHSIIAP